MHPRRGSGVLVLATVRRAQEEKEHCHDISICTISTVEAKDQASSFGAQWRALECAGAALAGAVLSLLLRQLGKGDAPTSVAIWYNLLGFAGLSAIVLTLPEQLYSINQAVIFDLILLGVIGAGLQIVLTTAYHYSDAVVVASMRYLQMPVSGVVGYFLFVEVMSQTEIIGALIIISSCLVIAWRELMRSREVNQPGI